MMKNPLSIFRRKSGPSWASLSTAEKQLAARRLGAAALAIAADAHSQRASFGKGYEAVTEPFTKQRRPAYVELKGEDGQLNARQRRQLINMHRDMLRNSPERVTQDQQFRVNVVGTVGGKCYANFPEPYAEAGKKLSALFNKRFFSRAEFTFRRDFNWLLKTCLTAQDSNGCVILVFDDGILTGGNGTGRIRGFEGDEIANVPQEELERRFGQNATQHDGLVYDQMGVFTGAFVSTSQRGRSVFTPEKKFFTLKFDPYDDDALTNWVMIGHQSRFNQGKPVSQLTAALTVLVDLHETIASEAQSTKLNSKLVGQILRTDADDAGIDADRPMGFTNAANPSLGSSEPVGELSENVEFELKHLKAIGSLFDQMPPNWKIELLDTKRPNPNLGQYLELLMGLVGGTRGMARVYSTLKAQTSYTAFRGEQVMTWPSFREASKDLERQVCDWAIRCFVARAQKIGLIDFALPDGWADMISWDWPKMPEVSEKDAAEALARKLANGTTSLHRELPPGEYERIREERRREAADFTEDGLIYPGKESKSGSIFEPTEDGTTANPDSDDGSEGDNNPNQE